MNNILKENSVKLIFGIGAVAVGLLTIGFRWAQKKSWILVGHVQNLYIFPLKSGCVIESQHLDFKSMGPQLGFMIDRGFAVAQEGTYSVKQTQQFTRLCMVKLYMENNDDGKTVVKMSSQDSITDLIFFLPEDFSQEPKDRFVSTEIIGGKVASVWDCGDEAASWISKTLAGKDSGLRLIYHYSDISQRSHSKLYLRPFGDTMGETHLPALSNVAPYHVVTQASVDELNSKIENLKRPLHAVNFRPNIVVKTLSKKPFQEDQWKLLKFGNTILEFSLPGDRCTTVNVNQKTAERDDVVLKWLKTNRRTLTPEQDAGTKQGIFGHRYGLKQGTESTVFCNQEVWAFM